MMRQSQTLFEVRLYDAAVTDLSVLTLKKYLQLSLRYFNTYHYDNIFFTVMSQ